METVSFRGDDLRHLRLLPSITDNNEVSVNVVIDKDAGIDLGNRPFSVYSFRGGSPWEPQMMSYTVSIAH